MFFWGSYSFQTPAISAELPGNPALRYPMYVPPPPALLPSPPSSSSSLGSTETEKEHARGPHWSILDRVRAHRLKVHLVSCGMKHIIATVSVIPQEEKSIFRDLKAHSTDEDECHASPGKPERDSPWADSDPPKEDPNSTSMITKEGVHPGTLDHMTPTIRLVGMGTNHAGQLGPHIPSYAATLVPLRLEERLQHLVCAPHSSYSTGKEDEAKSPLPPSTNAFQPASLHLIVSIACGFHHSLFVTRQGDVYACGENSVGQVGVSSFPTGGRSSRRGGGSAVNEEGERKWKSTPMKGISRASHGSSTAGNFAGASTCISDFTLLPFNTFIREVFANGNVSFAVDRRGLLYSWGDPQYGQLGHGDIGERIDLQTLKNVTQPVSRPTLVEWFSSRHLQVKEVAVGRQHMVCSTVEGELYSVGTNTFGKLGLGDVEMRLFPSKVSFPSRQAEQLTSFACGDDHTVVLRVNPTLGSTVYFFGRLSNGDGQLTPIVVSFPHHTISPSSPYASLLQSKASIDLSSTRLTRVFAGRGTQCAAINEDGVLWVWGKHSNVQNVTNGTPAWASGRQMPSVLTSLLPFRVEGVGIGSCMIVAYASEKREVPLEKEEELSENTLEMEPREQYKSGMDAPLTKRVKMEKNEEEEKGGGPSSSLPQPETREHPLTSSSCFFKGWDIAIPHDDRVGLATGTGGKDNPRGDSTEQYEAGVRAFLDQYLEGIEEEVQERDKEREPEKVAMAVNGRKNGNRRTLSAAYVQQLPIAPSLSPPQRRSQFEHVPTQQISVGDKIRLWMTDVYALGTVQEVMEPQQKLSQVSASSLADAVASTTPMDRNTAPSFPSAPPDTSKGFSQGVRVRVEWLRDDWQEEVLSLYSDDETLASENQNRWQPFWFEKSMEENDTFSYTTAGL